jgi:cytidylate kinase
MASKIAAIAEIRTALAPFLRSFGRLPGLVADGRDMGTVVFPNAQFKIFLTACTKERARRRFLQLQDAGINATLDTVLQGLVQRDIRDEKRSIAPLKPDPSAVIIDTTRLSIDETLQLILAYAKTK